MISRFVIGHYYIVKAKVNMLKFFAKNKLSVNINLTSLTRKILLAKVFTIFLSINSSFADSKNIKHIDYFSEQKLKMAFLTKFIEFVDNKQVLYSDKENINICVLGVVGKKKYDFFSNMKFDSVFNKPLLVFVNLAKNKLKKCQILYFTGKSKNKFKNYLPYANDNVITVGEGYSFFEEGGMIAFYFIRNKIRFVISNKIARDNGIMFNVELLKLGTIR